MRATLPLSLVLLVTGCSAVSLGGEAHRLAPADTVHIEYACRTPDGTLAAAKPLGERVEIAVTGEICTTLTGGDRYLPMRSRYTANRRVTMLVSAYTTAFKTPHEQTGTPTCT